MRGSRPGTTFALSRSPSTARNEAVRRSVDRRAWLLVLSMAFFAGPASAQHRQIPANAPGPAISLQPHASSGAAPAGHPRPERGASTRPHWGELSSLQHEALAPLAGHWETLSVSQKRKWLALSKNYATLPVAEKARMHGRMDDWVALSPQQRRTARMNYEETKRMPITEKQQKWEAYQALPPAARSRFTETAPVPPAGAATTARPAPRQKLARVPVSGAGHAARPLIALPSQLDPHTLLPQRSTASRPGAVGN